jgi:FkbM family methyltransferase
VPAGGLAFDIGAHVGDRVRAFRALGARVVAVEPQAAAMRVLRLLHGRDPQVALVREAIGAAPGEALLRVNTRNPTVSTLSRAFVDQTAGAPGWEGQRWDRAQHVRVTTLDRLVAAHGAPDFVKIDVEGHEAAALVGLSPANAPPALSFEVVAAMRAAGIAALDRAATLGYRRFRLSLGETHRFESGWKDARAMRGTLEALPDAANSGDVYAVREGHAALDA